MGFRFLHAADLHLDSPLLGVAVAEEHRALVRGASRRALEKLVELAIAERVAFVLLAGDNYDGDWRDHSTGLFFVRQLGRLRECGIPVYAISGNHDAESVITRKLLWPDNTRLLSAHTVQTERLEALQVAVHGISFPNRAVQENLVPRYPEAVAGWFNIGLLHTSLEGESEHSTYAPCSRADLRAKGYDYWALGHVHQAEIPACAPWIVYPGVIQGRHIRELGPKGCVLVEVNDAREIERAEFMPLDVLRWALVTVTLDGVEDASETEHRVTSALRQAREEAKPVPVIARVRLTGTTTMDTALRSALPDWKARIEACGANAGSEVMIERVEVATAPSIAHDAEDDGLLPAIRATAATWAASGRPVSATELVQKLQGELPTAARKAVDTALQEPAALLADAVALIETTLHSNPPKS